jgi:hypothetical protein
MYSVVLGVSVGAIYGAISYLSYRLALVKEKSFVAIVYGGMLIRLMLASVAILLILLFASVRPFQFLGSFFVVFVIGLTTEILHLHRRQHHQSP